LTAFLEITNGRQKKMSNMWNLFWIFIVIVSVMPLLQQKMMQAKRFALIRKLEKKRNSRVITLIHRQETMRFLGFPLLRYIDITDSEEILRAVRLTPEDMPIDIIIHTPGGLVLSAEQIAMALRRHKAKVTIFVPHYAMSGGTLLCLAVDEVVMDDNSVLGPVDPQLGEYPAVSILKAVKEKEPKDIDDKTLILADVAQKALTQMRDFVKNILIARVDEETAERMAITLTEGRWTHDYPITFEEAKNLGFPVTTGLPAEIYQLMDLFPQAMQQRPSVQYIPIPYKRPGEREKTN
jgi:ClpP class serine protease